MGRGVGGRHVAGALHACPDIGEGKQRYVHEFRQGCIGVARSFSGQIGLFSIINNYRNT